jgi:hypothetical protein
LGALAVVTVLLYHAQLHWIPGGFLGVEVSFVISRINLGAFCSDAPAGKLGDVMIVHIGNNGVFADEHFDEKRRVLRGVRKVVLIFNVTVPEGHDWPTACSAIRTRSCSSTGTARASAIPNAFGRAYADLTAAAYEEHGQ